MMIFRFISQNQKNRSLDFTKSTEMYLNNLVRVKNEAAVHCPGEIILKLENRHPPP